MYIGSLEWFMLVAIFSLTALATVAALTVWAKLSDTGSYSTAIFSSLVTLAIAVPVGFLFGSTVIGLITKLVFIAIFIAQAILGIWMAMLNFAMVAKYRKQLAANS